MIKPWPLRLLRCIDYNQARSGETTEQFYCRERRYIEAAQLADKREDKQTAFFTPSGTISGPPVPSSSPTSR